MFNLDLIKDYAKYADLYWADLRVLTCDQLNWKYVDVSFENESLNSGVDTAEIELIDLISFMYTRTLEASQ